MVSRTRFVADTHVLRWHFRSPERLSVVVSAVFRLIETGNATRWRFPPSWRPRFHYPSATLGRPTGTSALPVIGDLEMRKSSKVELTRQVVVTSSADSSRRQTGCSGGSMPGAATDPIPADPRHGGSV